MRPPVVTPLTKKVDEMFDFFQEKNARAAVVLNEFGGVEGFVTMRDVLNFIFGQTSGNVKGKELYQEKDENLYEVPGDMKLTDFNNLTNFGIEDPRMTTIGGVAFRHLDRLPQEADQVNVDGIVITVLKMKEHRISRVRVARGQAAEESFADAAGDVGTPDDSTAVKDFEPVENTSTVSGEADKQENTPVESERKEA
jgi:CBS domain containing-hemolysin-like protein